MNCPIYYLTSFLLVFHSVVFAQGAVAAGVGESHREASCDIKHIALDLRFDWEKKHASGTATISLSPLKPADHITLDSGRLSIQSVTDGAGKLLNFELSEVDGDDNLRIDFGRICGPDKTITVAVTYHTNHVNKADPNNIWGSFGKGLRFLQPTSTTPIKRPQIRSSGEPNGNRYWFPGNDAPNDLRTTEIKATVREPFDVISNGELLNVESNADGTRTFHFKTSTPHPNYLTSIVVGEYTPVCQTWDGIKITTYGYADEKAAVKATVERLPEMMEFFSDRTGVRYPYSRYSQVVVQDHPFPGRVGQHMVPIMSDNMIDDFRTHADFLYLWDAVEAQSLASQWFGNLIAHRGWRHSWLSQGFSRYFDGLFNIYANGRDEFLTYYVTNDMGGVLGAWKSNYRHPIVPDQINDLEQFTYDSYVKGRGALVLRMLQHELGNDTWWRVVRRYVKSNAGKLVTTDDLQAAILAETGGSLDWFFEQWVYGMGHPKFDVSQEFDAGKGQLQLTVSQTQRSDEDHKYPQVDFFQGRIRIAIDGRIETVRLEPKAVNTFGFTMPNKPRLVNFDHEDVWIKEVTFKKPLPELLHQLRNDNDVLGQRFAMQQLVKLPENDVSTKATRERIIAGIRDLIDGESYWRIRASAVTQLGNLHAPKKEREPSVLNDSVVEVLLRASQNKAAWLRTAAIRLLGKTHDQRFVENYIAALDDESDRVINAAATALGQTKSPRAFDVLAKLKDKPSWKSQSLISSLNGGLQEFVWVAGSDPDPSMGARQHQSYEFGVLWMALRT